MKIALLTNGIWPYVIGGMQKHSYYLCRHLARNGVKVTLVHTNQQHDLDIGKLEHFTDQEKANIESIVIDAPRGRYFPGHYVYKSYKYSKAVYEAIKGRTDFDFIISKSTTAWYIFNKKYFREIPIGINIHGYEFMQRKADTRSVLESWMLRWPFIYINKKADYVFSYGGRITEYIQKLGVDRRKIIEIPAAIEEDWAINTLAPAQPVRRFVFVGRFERRKGIQELTRVVQELAVDQLFEFHFVGPIPNEHRVDSSKVSYHGMVREKTQLQSILQHADVLVCPSYAEGMPNVILEGMANGCAIIATDVGAVRKLVTKENGWLVPPADSQSLRSAMLEAIKFSPLDMDKLRRASLDLVRQHYTWDRVIDQTIVELKKRIK